MTKQETIAIYEDQLSGIPWEEAIWKLDTEMRGKPFTSELWSWLFNGMIFSCSVGYTHYKKTDFKKSPLIQLYIKNIDKLPESKHYNWSVYYYFTGQHEKCIQTINKRLAIRYEEGKYPFDEMFLADYVIPYKNAFSGFWSNFRMQMKTLTNDSAILALTALIEEYYSNRTDVDTEVLLCEHIRQYPNHILPKEFLAEHYYSHRKWELAIPLLEELYGHGLLFDFMEIEWRLAYAYGKYGDLEKEEHYLRVYGEHGFDGGSYKNNLGYCLYRQGKYQEAEELFLECMEQGLDLSYAVSNYLRLLTVMGRNKEAKAFVKEGKYKIAKSDRERVNKLANRDTVKRKEGEPPRKTRRKTAQKMNDSDQFQKGRKEMKDFIEVHSNGIVSKIQGTNDRIPYTHQKDAMRNLDIIDHEDSYSTLVVLPTGGGKTYTASMWLLRHAINQHKKILWLAHRQMLLDQAAESFQKYAFAELLPNITSFRYRIVSGSNAHDRTINIESTDDIVIASKDSIGKNMSALDRWLKDENEVYLIIDEAHHATAKTYRKIIDHVKEIVKNVKLIGLTATPFRTAESEQGLLAKIFPDGIMDNHTVRKETGIAYQVGLKELINKGILAKPIFESCYTDVLLGEGLGFSDWESISRLDTIPDDIAEELTQNAARNHFIVDTYKKKQDEFGQTIVFTVNIKHAIALSKLFNDAGIPADYVVSSIRDGATGVNISSKDNERKLEAFRNGKLQVLVNVNILTEGVDLPQTKTVFLTRPTVSTILMTQMIGRALRGTEAGGTETAHIVSFIDDWNEHIAWVNPESLFVDTENDFTEDDAERQKYEVQLIAISKIEEFASILDKSVDTTALETIDFMKRIPIGMYAFTFMMPGDMEQSHQIMVYDSTKEAYEQMMSALPELFNEYEIYEEYPNHADLRRMAEQIKNTYFIGEMIPPYSQGDVINVLRYYAQYEIAPKFYDFNDIDRNKLDVAAIAKEVWDKDMRRSEEHEYLERLWNGTDDNILRLFFGQKKNFLEQYNIEMLKLNNAELYQKPQNDNVKYGKRNFEDMPLYQIRTVDSDYEKKLRDDAFEQAKNEEGYYICAGCGRKSKSRIIFQVDHIMSLNKGGKTVPENLQILCRSCNAKKGDSV